MNRFVLKNTFIKIYIYHFLINIFIKTRSQSYTLETVSLSKTTSFSSTEGVQVRMIRSPRLHFDHLFVLYYVLFMLINL
jgi:hypothetical protein